MDAEPSLRDRVRSEVVSLLERSAAYRALPGDRRARLADDMTRAGELVVEHGGLGELPPAGAVDFPAFVASLIQGVFQAVVGASIEQMKAYAELVASVSKSLDDFADSHVEDAPDRDWLADRPGRGDGPEQGAAPARRPRLARSRQQLLATMVLSGVSRIAGT